MGLILCLCFFLFHISSFYLIKLLVHDTLGKLVLSHSQFENRSLTQQLLHPRGALTRGLRVGCPGGPGSRALGVHVFFFFQWSHRNPKVLHTQRRPGQAKSLLLNSTTISLGGTDCKGAVTGTGSPRPIRVHPVPPLAGWWPPAVCPTPPHWCHGNPGLCS